MDENEVGARGYFSKINSRGIIFTLDSFVACAILLFSLFLIFAQTGAHAHAAAEQAQNSEKEFFAAALSEAIVKNRDDANPFRGSAYYNEEKKRVEANVLDEALLLQVSRQDFGKYSLEALYERDADGTRYFFNSAAGECIAVERFVVMKRVIESKTIIGVVVCGK
ncbi:MAG TPA: hypothetical protein VJH23_00535 [archaeon]|nr:hypothetical protein [archaeon]